MVSNADSLATLELEVSYDELLKHAEESKKTHPLGFVNIDQFNPKFK